VLRSLPALLAGAVLLVLGALFSVVLLAVVAVIGLGLWAWLWWKTRKLRRAARDATGGAASGGQIIEGEAVVVEEEHVSVQQVLPRVPRSGE
jgi:hypothetical protein